MKKMRWAWRLAVLQLSLALLVPGMGFTQAAAAPANSVPSIRIGLMTKQLGILASSNGVYELINVDDGKVLAEFPAGEKARIGMREGKLVINNTVVTADRLRISPQKSNRMELHDRLIEVNNRRYRGTVEIFRTPGATGMTAVNILPVDDYIYGVLARTLSQEWPEQAIKAQAVAIRTFALFNMEKHVKDGFDLCDTADCLLYEGQTAEEPRIFKAIEDTRGMVMLQQGVLVAAYSHLSGGGYTENSENVFAKAYPYLRGVPDFDQTSPYFHWQKTISPQELDGVLKDAGYTIGTLSAIELSKRTPPPVDSPDRGISGRIKTITFIGKEGIAALTGEKIRSLLALPSTLFDLSVAVPVASIDSNFTDSYGDRDSKQIQMNLPPSPTGGLITDRPGIHRITGQKNETIFIDGFGAGNGVGFSQWGAKTMAEKAISPGPDYYVSILKHYYQGVTVEKWY